jgi:hypothetical protein
MKCYPPGPIPFFFVSLKPFFYFKRKLVGGGGSWGEKEGSKDVRKPTHS